MESTEQSTALFHHYIAALDGRPKTAEVIDQFVSDPALRRHILDTERGFPSYHLHVHQLVAHGDQLAVRATFRGTHKGNFAGIDPTGKEVTEDLALFYRVEAGRIAHFFMQINFASVVNQLVGEPARA